MMAVNGVSQNLAAVRVFESFLPPHPALSLGERERPSPAFCWRASLVLERFLRLFPLLGERARVGKRDAPRGRIALTAGCALVAAEPTIRLDRVARC